MSSNLGSSRRNWVFSNCLFSHGLCPCSFAYGTTLKHLHQLVHLGSAFTTASAAHVTNGLGRENKLAIGEHRGDVIGCSRAWAVNRAIFAREIFHAFGSRSFSRAVGWRQIIFRPCEGTVECRTILPKLGLVLCYLASNSSCVMPSGRGALKGSPLAR
jgi:hypothetical protein